MRVYNTYSRELEEFVPLDKSRGVRMYTCGPTVYSRAHIGNFRAYVFEDLLQRQLELRGYKVQRVMNLTDVDDKTIRGAREAGVPLREFTDPFKKAFYEDLNTLRIKPADQYPAATDQHYIDRMIAMIRTLVESDLAYQADDKSVYFRISKFPDYGKLSHIDLTQLQSTGRVQHDEYDKEHIGDFALWKAWDEQDGDVKWESPWGVGRPGWHIECSAMATALLGEQIDIHCGGVDNIFPHHEDEIAQSEGAALQSDGQRFVKYWLHGAHLLVEGKKMSKSLGNFFTLRDLLAKGFTGREIRCLLLSAHYRETFNFTLEGLQGARTALARIDECLGKLRELASAGIPPREGQDGIAEAPPKGGIPNLLADYTAALDNDLNISAAWGAIFAWVREVNRSMAEKSLTPGGAAAALAAWGKIDSVVGIGAAGEVEIPAQIAALLEARQAARKARDFKRADAIRDELKAKGWVIEDTPKGPKLKRIQP